MKKFGRDGWQPNSFWETYENVVCMIKRAFVIYGMVRLVCEVKGWQVRFLGGEKFGSI
jgi:hypothetical protein